MLKDAHLQRTLAALERDTRGFSDEAWARASPGGWTCAQIVEHLGKAYGSTAYIMDKCIADGAPKGQPPSWTQRVFITLIVDIGYFPSGRPAPAITLPAGLPGPEALTLARETLQAMDAAAARCEAAFGRRALVANHPILGGFTVGQWRRFHATHTRHHLRQIARLQG